MTDQRPKRDWFFWLMALFTVMQLVWFILLAVDFITHPIAPDATYNSSLFRLMVGLVIAPSVMGVSILVLRHAPRNVCGLFLLQWAILITGQTLRSDSAIFPYSTALNIGWVGIWLLPLFFPDGSAAPRRLRLPIQFFSAVFVGLTAAWGFVVPTAPEWISDPVTNGPLINPLAIPSLAHLQPIIDGLSNVALLFIIVMIVPSVLWRYFKNPGVVRQQIRWLTWVFFLIIFTTLPVAALQINTRPFASLTALERVIGVVWSLFITLAPFVAVGNAILRHRLYDIDIIIRRTLIYSILTAILGAVFFGGVTVTQAILRSATGQTSDLAVVVSTLAIAALFNPLRRRVQATIDRRFYRTKYDAQKTLEQFAAVMRDEVDPERVKAVLVGTIQETMQPKSIALWIREREQKTLTEQTK